MRRVRLLVAALLAAAAPARAAAVPSVAPPSEPTPVLLERAVDRGLLARPRADLILARALAGEWVPTAYRSPVPWEGTMWLLGLRERVGSMPPGPERRAIRSVLSPDEGSGPGLASCGSSVAPKSDTRTTAHFFIEYDAALVDLGPDGLSIDDYAASLETAWEREVGAFGWAGPPPAPGAPGYHARLEALGPSLYGYVTNGGTYAGPVGDNPSTAWDEGDASASCMVLNQDYAGFRSSPQASLDATTAHELNHAIQFGYGALDGPSVPDLVLVEAGATWIEDEVFDSSDDSIHYLWPDLGDDLGDYGGSPYAYWVVLRAITERFGTSAPDGGERILQRFWELTSRDEAESLEALDRALLSMTEVSLASAFPMASVALAFSAPCGGGYASPGCLEEGAAYEALRGPSPRHGAIASTPGSFSGSVPDNMAMDLVTLPAGGDPYAARLRNRSNGGRFRVTIGCDTGTGLRVRRLRGVAGPRAAIKLPRFHPEGCLEVVAAVTNTAVTKPNPSSSSERAYVLSVRPAVALSLRVRTSGGRIRARGSLEPPHAGDRVVVTLLARANGRYLEAATRRARLRSGGDQYAASFPLPDADRCRVHARFPRDRDHAPTARTRTLACWG